MPTKRNPKGAGAKKKPLHLKKKQIKLGIQNFIIDYNGGEKQLIKKLNIFINTLKPRKDGKF